MKKNYLLFSLFLLISMTFSSCIKEEALNTEADIETASIPKEYIKLPTSSGNDYYTFFVNTKADITKLAPEFTLTEGATIEPASGTVRDFTNPQYYTVTSQDRVHQKTYKITITTAEFATKYSFEYTKTISNNYYEWWEKTDDNKELKIWDTANQGYNLSFLFASGKPNKDNFITTIEPEGKIGQGVRLQTLKTGKTGQSTAPISAGNFFLGKFVTNISKPLESPRFGIDWQDEPAKITGYFKYKAGENFEVNGKETNLTKDTFDMYAVYFKKDNDTDYLKATHRFNFLTEPESDPRIISYARIKPEDRIETDQWTYFELPFHSVAGRKANKNDKYMLAIVFSSSLEGDLYNGAIGSTLSIDEVEIIMDKEMDKENVNSEK